MSHVRCLLPVFNVFNLLLFDRVCVGARVNVHGLMRLC